MVWDLFILHWKEYLKKSKGSLFSSLSFLSMLVLCPPPHPYSLSFSLSLSLSLFFHTHTSVCYFLSYYLFYNSQISWKTKAFNSFFLPPTTFPICFLFCCYFFFPIFPPPPKVCFGNTLWVWYQASTPFLFFWTV